MCSFFRTLFLSALTLMMASCAAIDHARLLGKTWDDFSTITITGYDSAHPSATIALGRFSDGGYARIDDGQANKEAYCLYKDDICLYRGFDPLKYEGPMPSPFFGLDLGIGGIGSLLFKQFPRPSDIPSESTPFAYSDDPYWRVHGVAQLTSSSEVVFHFVAVAQDEQETTMQVSGMIKLLPIGPVPDDTVISGWTVVRGIKLGPDAQVIPMPPTVSTLGQMKAIIASQTKP